jgi:hypothetical protein
MGIEGGQAAASDDVDEGNPALDVGVLNAAAVGTIRIDDGILKVTSAADLGDAGTLTLDSGTVAQAALPFSGGYDSDNFSVVMRGNQTTVTYLACFAVGVRILTLSGGCRGGAGAGRPVVTRSGRPRPVRWIGHRRIEPARHPRPQEVCPVRVHAHAFEPGMPHRDLLLSPDHAVFMRGDGEGAAPGALIPVRYLVNGATVVQEAIAEITYYHVELPALPSWRMPIRHGR